MTTINYNSEGLIPAIIQEAGSNTVLMLGYMNKEAFEQTLSTGNVTFFSRSKQRLWMKGETSGNVLRMVSWQLDCDKDALLIKASPEGNVCHTGSCSCFSGESANVLRILYSLERMIDGRFSSNCEGSYVRKLKKGGFPLMARKVGEEAAEVMVEAFRNEPHLFLEECADLLFHLLVLIRAKELKLADVLEILRERSR